MRLQNKTIFYCYGREQFIFYPFALIEEGFRFM